MEGSQRQGARRSSFLSLWLSSILPAKGLGHKMIDLFLVQPRGTSAGAQWEQEPQGPGGVEYVYQGGVPEGKRGLYFEKRSTLA